MPALEPNTIPRMDKATVAPTDARSRVMPPAQAGRNPAAIGLFLTASLMMLASDLVVKELAFRCVAGRPVRLTSQAAEDPAAFWRQYPHEPITIIPGTLSLNLLTNSGAVFGLGKGGRWLFVAVSLVAAGLVTGIFWRSPGEAWGLHIAMALILAGALGNLYDRLVHSVVRDMLLLFPNVHLPFGWTWPGCEPRLYPWIFNLADASLLLGVAGVLLVSGLNGQHRRKIESTPD